MPVTKFKCVFAVLLLFAAVLPAFAGTEDLIDTLIARARYGRTLATDSLSLTALVDREAAVHGIPIALARAVVRVESQWNPRETGGVGEVGLMQIKHSTARFLGFAGSRTELYDPKTNVRWGMKYLAGAYKLANGNVCKTALKYQGGHAATRMTGMASRYCSKLRTYMASKD